ncbi:MAG TPA: serine--tRNA ligase [Deltaproteobacteria bacterium]|nr:serine--tRNA ligase [Deltaproteobacteria bacterium]HPR55700.1 serine--tRNA ligase [Deltaproteobacteria bacterium]
MLDVKFIRQNAELVKTSLRNRGASISLDSLMEKDNDRRALIQKAEELKATRNQFSMKIAKAKGQGGDLEQEKAEMRRISDEIKTLDSQIRDVETAMESLAMEIPNIPHESVPVGSDSNDNQVVRTWGERPQYDFTPKDHWDVGENLGVLDFKRAAKITGARFTVSWGLGSRLERALINFMLDVHTGEHGCTEVWTPFMTNRDSMTATGQLPKFEEELFRTDDYFLVPTAEVPVTNLYRDETLAEEDLPIKLVAYTPCFRREAGSYGKDTRGLIRQHQFNKVELVRFAHPDRSFTDLEELTADAEDILKKLGLHYRVVVLCTGDLGFSSAKTYDLEVWMPAQGVYREISSCSNFVDFQSRRGQIRYKAKQGKKTELCHTLNGSGLAVGRTVAAILENYQQADGTVKVPEALKPYMGVDLIGPIR